MIKYHFEIIKQNGKIYLKKQEQYVYYFYIWHNIFNMGNY